MSRVVIRSGVQGNQSCGQPVFLVVVMVPFYAVQVVVVDVDLMFPSVDLLDESNIHSKDVSS